MSKMVCISIEDFELMASFVFGAHDMLEELKECGHGKLRPEEQDLLDDSWTLMKKIDEIDTKIKGEEPKNNEEVPWDYGKHFD